MNEKKNKDGFYDEPKVVRVISLMGPHADQTIHTRKKSTTIVLAGEKMVGYLSDEGNQYVINPKSISAVIVYRKAEFDEMVNNLRQSMREQGQDQSQEGGETNERIRGI